MAPSLRTVVAVVSSLVLAWGCAAVRPPELPEPDVDLGLGEVVLLNWTTRSPEGILGHAMVQEGIGVDPHRRVVDGQARWVETSQHMRFLYSRELAIDGQAQGGVVAASAGTSQATHVAYEVHVTRYLDLMPNALHYAASSNCCLSGAPSASCGKWFVNRMIWGTGRVQYLKQAAAGASVSATGLLRAQGGTAYRLLNEFSFNDAFFAYEASPLEDLCSTVAPDEELASMTVHAPKNCWGSAQRRDGTRAALSWNVADEASCRESVRTHCLGTSGVLGCYMTFGTAEASQQSVIPLELPPQSPNFRDVPTTVPSTPTESSTPGGAPNSGGQQ